jgi:hypothetical protein
MVHAVRLFEPAFYSPGNVFFFIRVSRFSSCERFCQPWYLIPYGYTMKRVCHTYIQLILDDLRRMIPVMGDNPEDDTGGCLIACRHFQKRTRGISFVCLYPPWPISASGAILPVEEK